MITFTVGQLVHAVRPTGPLDRGHVAVVHDIDGDMITIRTMDGQLHTDDGFMFYPEDDTITIVTDTTGETR